MRIRYGGIIAGQEEIDAVNEVLLGQGWASGKKVEEFEAQVAYWHNRRHALFVNSGSSALLLSMTLLPPKSRIAMPALQFPTLYSSALWCRHAPVLIDIDDSLNMDPAKLEKQAKYGQVDAVAFVHMAGNSTNIGEIASLCRQYKLPLIEDICEAFGAKANDTLAGNFGLASAASTHGAHHLCTGEGGLVFTDDTEAYKKMKRIRDWGRAYDSAEIPGYYQNYVFSELGLNLHNTDIGAALGIEQLKRVDGFIERRQENWRLIHAELPPDIKVPRIGPWCEPSWFAFPMLVPHFRSEFIEHLEMNEIECRTIVAGNMPRQPICHGRPEDYPVADKWFHNGLWISAHPKITGDDIYYLGEKIREFWGD